MYIFAGLKSFISEQYNLNSIHCVSYDIWGILKGFFFCKKFNICYEIMKFNLKIEIKH